MKPIEIVGVADGEAHPVLGYCRVSTTDEGKQTVSPEAQAQIITDYARRMEFPAVEIIKERGSAASLKHRPELQRILAMCRAGQVQHVIVQDLSRLYREMREALNLFHEMEGLGVTFHSAVEGSTVDPRTRSGRLLRGLKLLLAEDQRLEIGERTSRALRNGKTVKPEPGQNPAMRLKASQGQVLCGTPPYGYHWNQAEKGKRRLIPCLPEQRALARMLELRAQGLPYRQIALRLLQEGVRRRSGGTFNGQEVQRLLAHPLRMEEHGQHQPQASEDVLASPP